MILNFIKIYEESINGSKRKTIAIMPGSYRPPHIGHWYTIEQYAKKADEVVVIISAPSKKSERKTNTGKTISAEQAKSIFELYKKVYGLNNVKIVISKTPSPIKSAYDYAEKLKDANVIFGSSKDSEDLKRWNTVEKYMKEHNPSITVLDPKKTAVERKMSATKIRNNIDDISIYKKALPQKLSDSDIQKVYNILNRW